MTLIITGDWGEEELVLEEPFSFDLGRMFSDEEYAYLCTRELKTSLERMAKEVGELGTKIPKF